MVFGVDPRDGYSHLLEGRGKRAAVIYTSAVWGPGLSGAFGSNFRPTYFEDRLRWTGITDITPIRCHPTLNGSAEEAPEGARRGARTGREVLMTALSASTQSGALLDAARLTDHVDARYRAARALCGSRTDAEDLVQGTFARVLKRARFIRRDRELGYLLQALRNTYSTGTRGGPDARRPSRS